MTDLGRSLAQKLFFHLCEKIAVGTLTVSTPDGHRHVFGNPHSTPQAELRIFDDSLFGDLLSGGEWGLGWGYVHRKWDAENVKAVCLIFMLNEEVFRPYIKLAMAVSPWMQRVNARSDHDQSTAERIRRQTISACYDVGNDFYTWMLGPSMAYTCAIWPRPDATLEEAQENKFRIVTEKARIEPQHSVLELGCGFGSLSNYIHKTTGARPRAVALSRQQIRWAQEHYPHLDFEYLNYVHVTGLYDRIVSVGMGEHVGRQNFDAFLRQIAGLLKPGGRFVCHMMSCYDGVLMYSQDKRWTSFASVTMPNGDVSSMTVVTKAALKTGALRIVHTETYGLHYARTGEAWLANCRRHREKIVAAYSDEFFRIYEYSWQMGAAAFETGMTLLHVVFEKQPYGADYRESIVHF
ncbi:MAG TPA: class I SAM-dependent methyltransferase [Pseudomonadota bacterium]|nr:class I SAM-dependent methyltransferase [Pseudomonadota bacterium]